MIESFVSSWDIKSRQPTTSAPCLAADTTPHCPFILLMPFPLIRVSDNLIVNFRITNVGNELSLKFQNVRDPSNMGICQGVDLRILHRDDTATCETRYNLRFLNAGKTL